MAAAVGVEALEPCGLGFDWLLRAEDKGSGRLYSLRRLETKVDGRYCPDVTNIGAATGAELGGGADSD